MRKAGLFFALLCLVLMAACSEPVQQVQPLQTAAVRTVTDDLGRAVPIPEKVDRVVSLAPSLTEMIFSVGAGGKLVGVTSFCNYPEEAKAIQKVGDTMTPNIENIIALKPQIVFVSTASQLEAFMATLAQQNIAVYVTDAKSIGDVIDDMHTMGDLLGTKELADQAADRLGERLMRYEHSPQRVERPKVFVQISRDPLFTVGKESFLTEVIARAKGESVTENVPTAYPKLSKETAAALNPDVIFLSDSDDNKTPNDVFKNSPAVKNGRVYRINADIISRPGPRIVDALEKIAEALPPPK